MHVLLSAIILRTQKRNQNANESAAPSQVMFSQSLLQHRFLLLKFTFLDAWWNSSDSHEECDGERYGSHGPINADMFGGQRIPQHRFTLDSAQELTVVKRNIIGKSRWYMHRPWNSLEGHYYTVSVGRHSVTPIWLELLERPCIMLTNAVALTLTMPT